MRPPAGQANKQVQEAGQTQEEPKPAQGKPDAAQEEAAAQARKKPDAEEEDAGEALGA